MFSDHTSYIRDISQTYIQSDYSLERDVFLRPSKEMQLDTDDVLLVQKPLYGVPDSGTHWVLPYHSHHVKMLNMTSTTGDVCLLFRGNGNKNEAMTVLQVDDSYGHANDLFLEQEEEASKRFQTIQSKPRNFWLMVDLQISMKVQ